MFRRQYIAEQLHVKFKVLKWRLRPSQRQPYGIWKKNEAQHIVFNLEEVVLLDYTCILDMETFTLIIIIRTFNFYLVFCSRVNFIHMYATLKTKDLFIV